MPNASSAISAQPTRQEKRDAIRERIMEKALREIAALGRSIVCQHGNHSRCKGGPDDQDTCICECHDCHD